MPPFRTRTTVMRRLAALLTTALAGGLLSVVAAAAPAEASTVVKGYVAEVWDGDTIDVDVWGDGTTALKRVRVAGIQAMEMSTYSSHPEKIRGECWGPDATLRLRNLVWHKVVRLSARSTSSQSRGRLLRHLDVLVGSTWVDVGLRLIADGLVIPDVNKVEYTRNRAYMGMAMWAAANHRGMYGDNDHCGSGPAQSTPLKVQVNWKGGAQVNGEWIKITNSGKSAIPLAGWWVRDNALRRYTFPRWAWVKAGQSVYVHPGKGASNSTHFYWGLSAAIFEDASRAPLWLGDGGYLFDPQGDLRGWQQYRTT